MDKLVVDNLHLSYGVAPILKGVSVTLRQGEVLALLGPSGSGKSTLLRAIAGLETPQQGRITVDGNQVFAAGAAETPAQDRNLGVVFQSYALWPHRTVFENVAYGLKIRRLPSNEILDRVAESLTQLGLGALGERYPHQLSGGQQQRVAIARALVYKPPVLLLDEPLSNLDAKLRDEAKAWLRSLIVDLKLSAILVTHDQGEAMAIADSVVLLNGGIIEQAGAPAEIYGQPQTLFAAQFMGANNTLTGTFVEQDGSPALRGESWSLPGTPRSGVTDDGAAVAVSRVEKTRLVAGPASGRLPVTAVTAMYLGERWQHVVRLGDALVRCYHDSERAPNDPHIEIDPSALWIFPRP